MKTSKTIKELIYRLEPVCYYYGMKPNEFWECEYYQVNMFVKLNMMKKIDEFKMEIQLNEATTNKMIRADSMGKRPKVIPLTKMFKNLFKKKTKVQSFEEQLARLRKWK